MTNPTPTDIINAVLARRSLQRTDLFKTESVNARIEIIGVLIAEPFKMNAPQIAERISMHLGAVQTIAAKIRKHGLEATYSSEIELEALQANVGGIDMHESRRLAHIANNLSLPVEERKRAKVQLRALINEYAYPSSATSPLAEMAHEKGCGRWVA